MAQNYYGRIASTLGKNLAYQQEAEASGKLLSVFEILSGVVDTGTQMYMSYLDMQYVDSKNPPLSDITSGKDSGRGNWQSQYAMWERRAKANYESLTNLGYSVKGKDGNMSGSAAGSMNTGNYTNMKKALREAQSEMSRIRREASRAGVSIPQSKWETATVGY